LKYFVELNAGLDDEGEGWTALLEGAETIDELVVTL
jgi:hypothetical protein